ncbi:MAG: hypothetical protein U0K54_07350 [Acutalibacteraceae bacterium]|nr:hypothetical protein [Acutalibacteraceae bacterium]
MTLKTSSNKPNIAFNLFAFTLKKNLGFTIITSVLVLLFSPIFLINTINNYYDYHDVTQDMYNFTDEILPAAAIIIAVAAMFVVWLLQIINFNYLNQKSGSDAFHSMPITRVELLFSRTAASYLGGVIPLTLGYIGMACVGALKHVELDFLLLGKCYGHTLIMMLFCLAFSQLFILASGCTFDSIISFLAVNIGIPVIILLIYGLCENTLFGYWTTNYYLAAYGSPFALSAYSLILLATGKATALKFTAYLIIAVATVGLFCLNAFIYNIRKSEKAGETFAFKFMPIVISIIISFVSYFIFGYIFDGYTSSLLYVIMGVVGTVLVSLIYNVIVNRGFKKLKKAIIPIVITLVLIFGATATVQFDLIRFESYVPAICNIQRVDVHFDGDLIAVTEPNDFMYVSELHNAIVKAHENNQLDIEVEHVEKIDQNGETYLVLDHGTASSTIEFTYNLKGGRQVNRRYYIPNKLLIEEKLAFVQNCFADGIKKNFIENLGNILTLSGEYNGQSVQLNVTREEALTLLDAYVKDLKNADQEYFTDNAREFLWLDTTLMTKDGVNNRYYSMAIGNFDSFVNTKQVLFEMNIKERNVIIKTDSKY